MTNLTYDEVIEQYRQDMGADKVHISLGDNATPESLQEALNHIKEKNKEYYNIPLEIRLESEIMMLREKLNKLSKLGKSTFSEFLSESPKITEIKRSIQVETDIIPDVHQEEAIQYWKDIQSGQKHRKYR